MFLNLPAKTQGHFGSERVTLAAVFHIDAIGVSDDLWPYRFQPGHGARDMKRASGSSREMHVHRCSANFLSDTNILPSLSRDQNTPPRSSQDVLKPFLPPFLPSLLLLHVRFTLTPLLSLLQGGGGDR